MPIAQAGELSERLAMFPLWSGKPSLDIAVGDLIYPDWFEGTWRVRSVLKTQIAPLAPEIVTPGFQQNEQYLEEPVSFEVRFRPTSQGLKTGVLPSVFGSQLPVVSDRAFNGLRIARAYLGESGVRKVKVDPANPNRQLTELADQQVLVSTVTARASETPSAREFISSELTQQQFRGQRRTSIYLNQVETTTGYRQIMTGQIQADQVTAIYLSPQDPNFFDAGGRPVALYRYHLDLKRLN
ncbi:MAG: DUF6816 family protein [Cyanobacteria bacterium P01_H01_bin.15]